MMNTSRKLMATAFMTAALTACGGGGGGDSSDGGSSPQPPQPPTETPQAPSSSQPGRYIYYSNNHDGTREIELDPQATSATVTLGADTFTYTYNAATESFKASDGYSLIGGLDGDNPGAQVCRNGQSIHLVLPASATVTQPQALAGKSFKWYEDCQQGDGKGEIPSSVTFNSDGSLSIQADGGTESVSAAQVNALFSEAGYTDSDGKTKLHAYQIGTAVTVVFRQIGKQIIAAWTYEP
ncbi:hypothetical protein DZC30_05455 [Comamonas testosteroni]|uniref:Lipoprotein n=1 Tax=Comamonas testosteroni TaxID=285 RepID=A0A373FQ13_COMTE|nr:hypothetical protein [Comamonas testosteroni]RGE46206.1 hypothetical protein DZC30_05455 [Comamonas testosteroni]